jgi:hypothetical protein
MESIGRGQYYEKQCSTIPPIGQNTRGYLNDVFTNDYANNGNIFPDYIA